jgi:hypothetical protein
VIAGTAVSGVLLLVYEQLRRARRNDFPFLFEPLFLHGLLLVAIGVVAVILVKMALGRSRVIGILAALLIGIPSIALAGAPYLISVLEWSFVPERLLSDGFHQMGMLGTGSALALLVLAMRHRSSRVADESDDV